jgi:hypothetical protein
MEKVSARFDSQFEEGRAAETHLLRPAQLGFDLVHGAQLPPLPELALDVLLERLAVVLVERSRPRRTEERAVRTPQHGEAVERRE